MDDHSAHSISDAQTTTEARALRNAAAALKEAVRRQDRLAVVASTLVPLLLVALKFAVDSTTPVAVFYALVVLFALALGVDRKRDKLLAASARARELHDCDVLAMPWSRRAAGAEPTQAERDQWQSLVAQRGSGHGGGDPFPREADSLPLAYARIACQSLAVYWEPTAVGRYVTTLVGATGALLVAVVALGWLLRPGPEAAVTSLLALLPVAAWTWRERRRWDDAGRRADRVTERLLSAWRNAVGRTIQATSLPSLARSIQDDIFAFRLRQPIVPAWAATRYWERMSYDARRIDQFVDEYEARSTQD